MTRKSRSKSRKSKSPRRKKSRRSRTRYETRYETKYVYVPRTEYKYVPYFRYSTPQVVERHHYHEKPKDDVAEIKKRYHDLTGMQLSDEEARAQIRGGMLDKLRAMR